MGLGAEGLQEEQEQRTGDSAEPLLTIAIPTFNRSRYLRELLSCIAAEVAVEKRIELLISDNASSDDTPEVVEEFRRVCCITSIRNPENIGPDANFLQCLQQASGKYVWILGDDDIVVPGGVRTVTSFLKERDYDLVYLNSFPLTRKTNGSVAGRVHAAEFYDACLFSKRVHIYFSFISGNIINKRRFSQSRLESFASSVGTNLVQLSWVFAALNQFESGLHVSTKLVGARVDNTGGYKLGEVFATKLKRIVDAQIDSPQLRKVILGGTVQRYWPGLLIGARKQTGFHEDPDLARTLREAFGSIPKYWVFVYPILVLPAALGSAWFLGIRALNRIDRALGYIL